MNMDQLTEYFKWMMIINIAFLFLSTFSVMGLKSLMFKMHTKMFGVTEEQVSMIAYGYLAMYKVLVIVFNIVPYVALLILK